MDEQSKTYLFIDESGDPAFFVKGNKSIVGQDGFKPLLLIGAVVIKDKKLIRNTIINFMEEIKNDPLYNTLPCFNKEKKWYLHASFDNTDVQIKFIDFLRKLDGFKFYCVIGRKRTDLFRKKHNNNETEFYFDLLYNLLKDRLNKEETEYQILLSARHKNTQHKLKEAIDSAIKRDNSFRNNPKKIKYNSEIVNSRDTPELSIVDYLLWVLQRYIIKGDKRFYNVLESKYNLIIDLYDFGKYKAKGKSNYYSSKNRFSLEKAEKFRSDGYI